MYATPKKKPTVTFLIKGNVFARKYIWKIYMDKEALPTVSSIYDFPIFLDNLIINSVPQNDCNNNKGSHVVKAIFPIIPPKGILKIKSHIVINKNNTIATFSYFLFIVMDFSFCPIQMNGNNKSAC